MSAPVQPGASPGGGIVSYPLEQLLGEVAFIAFHFHWSEREIMELEHGDRRGWVEQISSINVEMNETATAV
jgi:hypothetical protein